MIHDAAAAILPAVPDSNPVDVTTADLERLLRQAWEELIRDDRGGPRAAGARGGAGRTCRRLVRAAPDARLRQVMEAAVRHLHAFLREVRPTEAEWKQGIDFLTAVGHATNDRRQEFVLLSDTLGASMQTIAVNHQAYGEATEATVLGPFFVDDAPYVGRGGDIAGAASGQRCWVEGTIVDTDGKPVGGARIDVWEADADGFYDVQYDDHRTGGRAHLFAAEDGTYQFWAVTPPPYPIPDDGPVGRMLSATGRSPMRASHLHFMVRAAGMRTLVTHIFVRRRGTALHRQRLRGEGLPRQGLRRAARRDPHPGRPGPARPDVVTHPLRHRARTG